LILIYVICESSCVCKGHLYWSIVYHLN
jgi:hypothetical protein